MKPSQERDLAGTKGGILNARHRDLLTAGEDALDHVERAAGGR